MDAIEPILPNPSILPEVQAAQRSAPIHRDGGNHGGQDHRQRRHPRDEEAVEVDVAGVTEPLGDDEDADGRAEPPARRIDLSA